MAVGVPLVIGLVHVALVAPRYHVGSFDDDASYIITAKALLAGSGLTGHVTSGQMVAGLYAPGYSALLVPLVWLWPHSFLPLRLLSVACFASLFPLTWVYMGRRRLGPAVRTGALVVLALGPPLATFASMVMAEAPYLVVVMLLLLAVDEWQARAEVISRWGVTVALLSAGAIWLKEAGLGLIAGLVLWLLLSRRPHRLGRAVLVAGVVALSLVPVIVARLAAGIPLAGARYSQELGGYYHGGLVSRLEHVVPSSTLHMLSTAIPATVVPYLGPLPLGGAWTDLWKVLSWQVTILAAVGAFVWFRRHRDAAVPMAVVYLGECVLWPEVNERRAILVIPLLVAWYALGAATVWAALRRRAPELTGRPGGRVAGAILAAAVTFVPLAVQAPRDYLFGWGQSSSHFAGSRYVALLRALGRPQDVVETDYQSSTALFTGHRTDWSAFTYTSGGICYLPGVLHLLASDRAGYLLLGDLNKPGVIDSPCLSSLVDLGDWAVPLLHTARDDASVFELVGPDSAHPGLSDRLSGVRPVPAGTGPVAAIQWDLGAPAPVSQVSVGEASSTAGPTQRVRVLLRRPGGRWLTVASAASAVGGGPGRVPFLLARLGSPVTATAVRVVVDGPGRGWTASVSDVAVLGPGGPS